MPTQSRLLALQWLAELASSPSTSAAPPVATAAAGGGGGGDSLGVEAEGSLAELGVQDTRMQALLRGSRDGERSISTSNVSMFSV